MQYCMCHAKYFFNSRSPTTRADSVLPMRSRKTTRLMPPFTRTDGHNMPARPEFLAARPNAWQSVSKPLSLIFVKFSRIQLDNLSHAGRSAAVRSSTDESAHSIPHVIRGFNRRAQAESRQRAEMPLQRPFLAAY